MSNHEANDANPGHLAKWLEITRDHLLAPNGLPVVRPGEICGLATAPAA